MDTVYPDDDEIKFRNKKFKGIEDLLNNKVECTICNNDLLNEIITKKMIMVHRSYLFLCCYKCFYKLCEGQEYSCILCKSNNELSNCEKCNFNVCKRCVENHNIIQVFNGVINKCFNCEPQALWKQRAQAANVLTTFSSQLDLPNGLLVNEVEREQIVRKYLVNESKISQSSTTDKVKNHLCFNFILNTYKCTVTEKLSNFPKIDCIPFDKCIIEFMENCEYILERTCSTLTNFKRIFNLSSNLSPGVISMIKTLLKSVDEDDSIFNSSRYNIGNECKVMKNNEINEISTVCKTKTKSKIKQNTINCILNSTLSTLNNETNHGVEPTIFKEPTVLLERIDESIFLKKMNNKLTQVLPNTDKDETVHPLDLFDDLSSISSDTGCSRILRSSTKKTKKMNKLTKNKCPLNEKSDDEKENDRLTKFNKINQRSKTNNRTDINLIDVNNSSSIVSNKNSKNKENKVETMQQIIKNLDDTDSGSDNGSENDYSQESAKDIFKDINNSLLVPQINSDVNSDDSDDSSINDVINTCLITCKRYGIDHYRNKNQENKIVIDDIEKSGKFDESEEITEISEFSDKNDENVTANPSKNISPFRMPSLSDDNDSDFNVTKKMDSNKRKLITTSSSNESDSSSKYFKKSPKKRTKSKNNFFELTYSSCSNYSDSECLENITTRKRRRIRKLSTDNSDKESDDERSNSITTTPTKGRKNIRKMKNENELSELTKDALKEEKSRKMRMEKRQQIYNQIYDPPTPIESCKKLVLDFDSETKEELITVHPDLVKFLKPHQVDGVKFLWDSVFESLEFIKQQKKGSGSILAHCMGLGKTLQVITLIHTLFRYPEIGIKTVLIITPHTTIENWCKEFKKWLNNVPEETNFFVHNFSETKTYESRKNLVDKWQRENGVLVTSYQSYRAIVQFKGIDKFPTLLEALVDPGPDLIICDEGHLLKNHSSAISKTVNRIKTLRRIVLTGTPLQNNLKEYHCMVDFIRPNLLGSLKDFTNRFINPITNGQYSDSTPLDVALMKRRSHVLHRMLEGFVQRRDYAVLTPFLPPKQEYVIYLKMSDKQIELYKKYLDKYRQSELFANYHMLQMIWTHPKLLAMYSKQVEKKKLKDMESKLTDKSDSESHSNSIEEIENVNHNWWKEFMTKKDFETVYPYSKFIMLFSLLQECEEIGDKVLIFSQSLNTLDLIQDFLENAENISDDMGSPYGKSWYPGEDFFRIDGSVNLKDREDCCDRFNDTTNAKMRLLLLSTKAFNLGVNLVAANRVIIFDVTWNPTLNVQSIFRVFRFGQTKPCYIYRFVSEGTMEQKIYQRQISKLSMAFRVVDEHQIDRHFNAKNQEELYEFAPNTSAPKTVNLPKDRLMAELILKHKDLVIDILEHDSLLQNNEDEELDENDRNAAWEDYEKEKSGLFSAEKFKLNTNQMNFPVNNLKNNEYTLLMNSLPEDVSLFNTLRTVFPSASVVQLNDMLIQVKSQAEQ